MSSTSDTTLYELTVEGSQPSGGVFLVSLNLVQEADFGDAEAQAMLAGLVALVPPAWSPFSSMSKTATNQTMSNWNATTQTFE